MDIKDEIDVKNIFVYPGNDVFFHFYSFELLLIKGI